MAFRDIKDAIVEILKTIWRCPCRKFRCIVDACNCCKMDVELETSTPKPTPTENTTLKS